MFETPSSKRISKALNNVTVRTATPEEILTLTGFPCGGTPSFAYDAIFIIDPKVLEQEWVYTGGGSARSLIKIETNTLQELSDAMIARIRK